MEKILYVEPVIEIYYMDSQDIITGSGEVDLPDDED